MTTCLHALRMPPTANDEAAREPAIRRDLSEQLCELLSDLFTRSLHVRQIGLQGAEDSRVASYAAEHGLIVVSKDADFVDRVMLSEANFKTIWVRLGNCTTAEVHLLLRNSFDRIETFDKSEDAMLKLP
jgi:predicted nuclease of predicted toxin-antitoxin system